MGLFGQTKKDPKELVSTIYIYQRLFSMESGF